jgi:2-keto-4-pentenoate hydratase/2-oxohepta-3-ene-1,7-dioic acid hydratase in catechol pathway
MAIKLPIKGTDDTLLLHPAKIVCLGRNYPAHAKELGREVLEEPILFGKTSTCLIPSGGQIVLPKEDLGVTRVDHEVELAVIIGREGKDITEEEALDHVFGYTVFNDVTARNIQRADIDRGLPWFRSKNYDTFGPIGPCIVLAGELDPQAQHLQLAVNGEVHQDGTTADMVFQVPYLIAYISKHMTLEEGDIIATGTPEGISPLHDGDHVEATIDEIGTLVNDVIQG